MDDERPVSFEEFEEYLNQLGEGSPRAKGLPQTRDQFETWWHRITVSRELCNRWAKRVRLGEQFLSEIAEEIDAMKRAA